MKKIKKTSISILFLITLLTSCSDETNISNPINYKKHKTNYEINYSCSPSNPNNPFDSAGIYHNLGLNAVISGSDTLSCNKNILKFQICWAISGWKMTWGNNDSLSRNDIFDLLHNFLSQIEGQAPQDIIERYSYNYEEKEYALTLLDILSNYTDSTNIVNLIDLIKSWEDNVKNSNLPDSCKNILLNMGSIARWSSAYWFDEYLSMENSAWYLNCPINYKNKQEITSFIVAFMGIIHVIAADYTGYRVGYAIGSLIVLGDEIGIICAVAASTAALLLW